MLFYTLDCMPTAEVADALASGVDQPDDVASAEAALSQLSSGSAGQ